MVSGPIGNPGRNAVSLVVEEHRADPDPAQIPHQNTEAKIVAGTAKNSVLVMTFHAQVNNLLFIPL